MPILDILLCRIAIGFGFKLVPMLTNSCNPRVTSRPTHFTPARSEALSVYAEYATTTVMTPSITEETSKTPATVLPVNDGCCCWCGGGGGGAGDFDVEATDDPDAEPSLSLSLVLCACEIGSASRINAEMLA